MLLRKLPCGPRSATRERCWLDSVYYMESGQLVCTTHLWFLVLHMQNPRCTNFHLTMNFDWSLLFHDLISVTEPSIWWSHVKFMLVILSLPGHTRQLRARGNVFSTYHHGELFIVTRICVLWSPKFHLNIHFLRPIWSQTLIRSRTELEISMLGSNSRTFLGLTLGKRRKQS